MSALSSRLEWVGPGVSAFAGGAATLATAIAEYGAARDGARPGGAPRTFRTLEAVRTLEDNRLDDPAGSIGEDGGPGYRTGLHGLVDDEEVGTVVVAGPSAPERVAAIDRLAAERAGTLFVIRSETEAGEEPGAPALRFLRENLVSTRTPGALVASLEATDFDGEVPFAPEVPRRPAGLGREDEIYLQAFRRMQGLRRSLDLGTRWVLFERNDPLLWRRLEREIVGFLDRLRAAGLLETARGDRCGEVSCRSLGEPAAAASESGVSIRVAARLAGPWGAALERRRGGGAHSERSAHGELSAVLR